MPKLNRTDHRRLGRHWRQRVEAALFTLIDAEGALYVHSPSGTIGGSLNEVCDGLRAIRDLDGVEPKVKP